MPLLWKGTRLLGGPCERSVSRMISSVRTLDEKAIVRCPTVQVELDLQLQPASASAFQPGSLGACRSTTNRS